MKRNKERKEKMLELIKLNKDKRKVENEPILNEIIEIFQPNIEVLNEKETNRIYRDLQEKFLFTSWGRIEWDSIKDKMKIINKSTVIDILYERYKTEASEVFVLWGYSDENSPVIKIGLRDAISNLDDICSFGGNQWLLCTSGRFVIEVYHEGEIVLGFADKIEINKRNI